MQIRELPPGLERPPRATSPVRPPHSRLVDGLEQFDEHLLHDAALARLVVARLLQLGVLGPEHGAQAGRPFPAEIRQLVVDVLPRARPRPLEYLPARADGCAVSVCCDNGEW